MSASSTVYEGNRRPVAYKPADASEHDLFEASEERPVVVDLIICNNNAGAKKATVKWFDGTTDWEILSGYSIPANDTKFFELNLPMRDGEKIKVTSETGNTLTFILTIVETGGLTRQVPK